MVEIIIKKTEDNVQTKKSFIVDSRVAKMVEDFIMTLAKQEREHKQ